jgi:hypothetical protein
MTGPTSARGAEGFFFFVAVIAVDLLMDFFWLWPAGARGSKKHPRLGQPWVIVKSFDQQAPTVSLTTTTSRTACDAFFNICGNLMRFREKVKPGF